MHTFRFTLAAIVMAASFGIHSAHAFSIDDTNNTNQGGSSHFGGDPDDSVPFPHLDDQGNPASANQQFQLGNGPTASFGFSPYGSQDQGPDAFQRAQERMQQ